MVYTIQDDTDTTTLPNIQSDKVKSSSGIQPIPLPESESNEALLIPLLGPLTTITISGVATGSVSTLQTFIAKLEKWITDGGKLSVANVTYVSTLNGTFSVRVSGGDWSWDKGNPNILPYFLEMFEGTFT